MSSIYPAAHSPSRSGADLMTDFMPEPVELSDLTDLLQELEEALPALGEVMGISELDGLLAAVAASPEVIPPEEWLPLIWIGEEVDEADLLARPEVPISVALIVRRLEEISDQLAVGQGAFEAVFTEDEASGEVLWQIWLDGFAKGMSLRPDAWEAIYARGGDAADAFGLLVALIGIADNDQDTKADLGEATVAELTANAHEILPEIVEVLAAARRREPVRVSKIGRNDPCSCGSGRKFKKCCGAG